MRRICVFAGSNAGKIEEYTQLSRELGKVIAENGLELVYGGSQVGLMGEVANEVLRHGGKVIGVMPTSLFKGEMVHSGLTQLIEVKDMHERKATMGQLSDAYVALPGGFGTFEELFEVVSWAQLGIHRKPIGLFNIAGYYTPLLEMVSHAVKAGFVREVHKQLFVSAEQALILIQKLKDYQPPELGNKWEQLSRSGESS
ncbi:TIGR00730 family Rossman fold protein [Brevibacillus humidisoli]|uniref:LOG family protein n=1 Tax=Brevibacillus humidisoli TaxID=2895522 RepID=UPI001E3A0E26|nr:TIGR00730 family Rossman fold protein [Brevibacillus humidisoli]UFJ42688.1 TIGR00730 family Rossman fold protein [Brevibacillus humidisoli]